ncbi:MAG: head-tail connector protein [Novosphingobium sp.]|nr:head-tail connector protein [Novosphingobium sp.]
MLTLDTAPATDPVTLAEVKAHIRVDHTDEDAAIADMILAATQRLDGRDGLLGLCLITQRWTLTLDAFASEIAIPLPPCQSIDAISYVDTDGVTRTLDAGAYQAFGLGSADGAKVRPAYGQRWPAIRNQPDAVAITFTAGFGDDPDDVPEPIRTAIKMRVGHLYEHRESVTIGSGFITDTPDGAEDFVRGFRTWTF